MTERSFRPVGYWLKLLDQLIEEDLDATLRPFGLTRRQWQMLNLLAQGPQPAEALESELGAFLETDQQAEDVLRELVAGGWAQAGVTSAMLTDDGMRRRDAAVQAVATARRRVSERVERTDYETTVATLEAMCRNLGWDPSSPTAR